MAFKAPLDSKYDDQVPISNKFNIQMLFSSLSNMKVFHYVKLVIINNDFYIGKLDVQISI